MFDQELSNKLHLAFAQVAKKVIQTARETGTPVVVWENGQVCKISASECESRMTNAQPQAVR